MKQYWQRLETRIDAMSLRERAMAFAIAALLLITVINTIMLDPLLRQQKAASQQVTQDQQQIAALQSEIQIRVVSHDMDPDAPNRIRLHDLKQQSAKLHDDLKGMQKGLVAPDKMASLLEDMLKKNGRLQLTSLRTLPAALLTDPAQTAEPEKKAGPIQAREKADDFVAKEAIYKHGVELVVQGSYSDILSYLTELEAMPWQLFWASAKLQTGDYPKATMTLTLFTLSLDKKWLHI